MKTQVLYVLFILFTLFIGCKKENSSDLPAINNYIQKLDYNPDSILEVQKISGSEQKTPIDTANSYDLNQNIFTVCENVKFNLLQNSEQVAIIRPTNGIIWPGALVKANKALLNGLPEPITLKASPVTLQLDLPGMGSHGTIVVENPTNSSVQAKIDEALEWWNNNAYQAGYVNPSNSSYQCATSFSSQQLSLELGLNLKWASGSVSAHLSHTSSSSKKVAMMSFKQVFYTVTLNTPESSSSVFDNSVSLSTIQSLFNTSVAPAYVHSVSYGRIIMVRLETSEEASSTEVEGALSYSSSKNNSVDANTEIKYKKILQNSSISVIIIGGNADTTSYAVTAKNSGDLVKYITGENAIYSKSNPGVPIAYTVKFLKDNKIAKMGYTTDYTANECKVDSGGKITVKAVFGVGYVARFSVTYTDYLKVAHSWSSGDIAVGNYKYCSIPGGSTNIHVHAWAVGCGKNIFDKDYPFPEDECFEVSGSVCFPNHKSVTCD